jgi:mannose-6-phosphate isomerase-like protein (cupin superfamily)
VLAFQRDQLCEGVHLARIALRQAENSTFHTHTITRDTFFVMAGRLTIEIRVGTLDPSGHYHAVCAPRGDGSSVSIRGATHRVVLHPGDVCVVEPGVIHCAMNLDPEPCHFLCIEGVGEYDFNEVGT